MNKSMNMPAGQRGFSILSALILVIILFGALIFVLAGPGLNSGFASLYANKTKASSVISSAGFIKTGFDILAFESTAPADIEFAATPSAAGKKALFDPSASAILPQFLDPSVFETGAANKNWIYRSNNLTLSGVGVTGTADYTIVAVGIKQPICEQLNLILTGAITIPTLAMTAADIGGTVAGTSPYLTATGVDTIAAAGKHASCYRTTETAPASPQYAFVYTLLPQ